MFISVEESCTNGFRKWANSEPLKHRDRPRAKAAGGMFASAADRDHTERQALGRQGMPSPPGVGGSL